MHYVYILKSKLANRLYFGYTTDLKSRFNNHMKGRSQYTKQEKDWELVYYEAYKSPIDAIKREKQLKKYAKAHGILKRRISNSIN